MARMTGEGSLGRTPITARTGEMGRDPMLSAKEFQRLGERTGGKGLARTANRSAVESVLKEIAGQVRSMYVASYRPEEGDKPRERVVRVELKDKGAGRLNGAVRKVVR